MVLDPDHRDAPLDLSPEEFRELGYRVVDRIANHIGSLRDLPVGPNEPVTTVRDLLGAVPLPSESSPPGAVLDEAMSMVLAHSVFTSHPRFWAFITGSASPLGALGDLVAASININVASWNTAGGASAFEAQAVRWIADLINLGPTYSGLLVSGGTAANLVAFITALHAKATWDVRQEGARPVGRPVMKVYASREAHPWLGRAVDITGLGLQALHWVEADEHARMIPRALRAAIAEDREAGNLPFLIVGSGGTVSLGMVDPLGALAEVAREEKLWLHVDAAYGGFAACSPEAPDELRELVHADSIAVDPHKWLYVPLECGCVLLKEPALLNRTFTYDSAFFRYTGSGPQDIPAPYREQGLQNSRAFRAFKLWLCLKTAGRRGYEQMISDDIRLARRLYTAIAETSHLEAMSCALSTTVFRYLPPELAGRAEASAYLETLNLELLRQLQLDGYAYPSATKMKGSTGIRVCIVNFRTQWSDLEGLIEWCTRRGHALDQATRPDTLR
ncbi:MAG: pyridoxal-dependent decarboxylase [Kofleriaceae bacterium]|nr:pyridoxal-dependent decarboxylase [Kofleriaceae bacterium]